MATPLLTSPELVLLRLDEADLPAAQLVFERTPTYHRLVMGEIADAKMARRCLLHPAPSSPNSYKVFKHFVGFARAPNTELVAVADGFACYPRYDIATLATFLVVENLQRKGLGTLALGLLETWLRKEHPALRWLDASIVDDNLAATRFLLSRGFERTDDWQKIEHKGKSRILLRFQKRLETPG